MTVVTVVAAVAVSVSVKAVLRGGFSSSAMQVVTAVALMQPSDQNSR